METRYSVRAREGTTTDDAAHVYVDPGAAIGDIPRKETAMSTTERAVSPSLPESDGVSTRLPRPD
jgi:hypothetical protein